MIDEPKSEGSRSVEFFQGLNGLLRHESMQKQIAELREIVSPSMTATQALALEMQIKSMIAEGYIRGFAAGSVK